MLHSPIHTINTRIAMTSFFGAWTREYGVVRMVDWKGGWFTRYVEELCVFVVGVCM